MKANQNLNGFTLIELLVVVLIIGILAAVAVPQYNKAVEKSRATQAMTLLKSAYQAADAYYMENGQWPDSFEELAVDIPWTGTVAAVGREEQSRSKEDWSLHLWCIGDSFSGFSITRLRGPYKGGGFSIRKTSAVNVPLETILCYEIASGAYAISTPGKYCSDLFRTTLLTSGSIGIVYSAPQ